MEDSAEVRIAARISKAHHEKILAIQKETKKKVGYEPTISDIIRKMIEDAPDGKKR